MKIIKYGKWDGSQEPFSKKRKDIVDMFMDNIMKGMSPNMSISQMLWEGFSLSGMEFQVMGIEEMLTKLQQQIGESFSKYSLQKIFDKPIDELKFLIADENMTRLEKKAKEMPSYDELPNGLIEKLRSLDRIDFLNSDSRRLLSGWKLREKDIKDLYEFYSEYSQYFTGDDFLDFDQALDLMRRMKSMEKLKQQIMQGQFSNIDVKTISELLGENAGKSFNILLELPNIIDEEGIAKFDNSGGTMTPKGVRNLGEKAFGVVYRHVKRDRQGQSIGNAPQTGEIEPDTSKPYVFGDRFDLDITKTILNSVTRGQTIEGKLELTPDDFHVREREELITSTTVLLLDLSWSMSIEGRFEAAKKVALALDNYIRTRFSKDKIHIVGFSTDARELKGNELALSVWDTNRPFTNLQSGLRLAMKLIKKSGNRNNRVIVITDGQPTAYYINEKLHVEMPNMYGISPAACKATLTEVRKVTAQGMNIETFMLDDNPVLVEFTHQISKINKGRAVMCMPGQLGELILFEEIKRREKK
ncbi:MAG: VWA domain-containing protein [Desulfobacterales bacterium]|nr:VWA domain-containing protein [Desulfobacteraceae bacterium]MBT4363428.1 VWA domain-containing protein [Desulfobacteraceae bacterium]MBT7087071.1 VWA domain-containing protein [Desulfobacterales bacterium]MBT7698540.1 VWA domain-containing protein [Desulfobacterales bacterium]